MIWSRILTSCIFPSIQRATGVRGKVGSRRQSIVHEELTAIGVGNDLNLIGWNMTIFEAFRRGATMDHEPWPNCLFPIDRASASQRVSKVRSSLSWRLLLEELLLLGSASRHGFRTINLQESLRDIEACLRSMQSKLYHMGFRGKV